MPMKKIDVGFAKSALLYDPRTGKLFWRWRDDVLLRHNRRYAGKEAFTSTRQGYKCGALGGKAFQAHRIAWAISHGEDPDDEIDHINGDRSDNRIENLRKVDRTLNTQNSGIRHDNTSGHVGVRYWAERGKWVACLSRKTLGYFKTFEDAVAARKKAELDAGYHVNHGRKKSPLAGA
jgi:hypothetical protein